jgi:hypothetical protein
VETAADKLAKLYKNLRTPTVSIDLALPWITGSPYALGALGHILACTGDRAAAKDVRRQLDDIEQTRYVAATIRAEVMTGLGEYYEALGWLKRALDERVGALWTFRVDPRFDQLRTEPGCLQILGSLLS